MIYIMNQVNYRHELSLDITFINSRILAIYQFQIDKYQWGYGQFNEKRNFYGFDILFCTVSI